MSTLNVTTIQHESGSGSNIVLDSDGNVEFADNITAAGDVTIGGELADGAGCTIYGDTASGLLRLRRESGAAIQVYSGSFDDAGKKVEIGADGGAKFEDFVKIDRTTDGYTAATVGLMGSSGNFPAISPAALGVSVREQSAGSASNNGCFLAASGDWHFSGSGNTRNVTLMIDADNPANYVSTTNAETGETVQVYSGPVLNVRETLLSMQAKIEALETKLAALSGPSTTDIQDN